jgi:cell wall-associated NlpC family hydrolase
MADLDIVAAARAYVGTPFLPTGRVKGHGIDCLGLLICAGWDTGRIPRHFDVKGYSQNPDGVTLLAQARQNLPVEIKSARDLQPGNIVVTESIGRPSHFGIIGDYGNGLSLIHASNNHRKVIEHRLIFCFGMRFVAGFKFEFRGAK